MKAFLRGPVLGLVLSLIACAFLLISLGEKPTVLFEALQNTLFTNFGLGYTLFYATPLIFTGLSVAVAAHCGLFNIGAEGQLYIGAMVVAFTGIRLSFLPPFIAIPVAIVFAALGAGLWGGLAGFFKAKRGSHEVIVTILMNFIAFAIVDYVTLYPLRNREVQNPESLPVAPAYFLKPLSEFFSFLNPDLFRTTPVNTTLFLAIAAAIACHFFLFKTKWGFELRAVGKNPTASRYNGISISKNTILAFFLSGALAGGVGVNQVMGYQHNLTEGFSPEYGFTGIAVALLAGNSPIGILFSAFLFGALHNSSRELEFLSERVTKELSLVLEATLIAFVASRVLLEKLWTRTEKKNA